MDNLNQSDHLDHNIKQINYAADKNLLLAVGQDGKLNAVSRLSYLGRCVARFFGNKKAFADCDKEKVAAAIKTIGDKLLQSNAKVVADLGHFRRAVGSFRAKFTKVSKKEASVDKKLKNSGWSSALESEKERLEKIRTACNKALPQEFISQLESVANKQKEGTFHIDGFIQNLKNKIKDGKVSLDTQRQENGEIIVGSELIATNEELHLVLEVRKQKGEYEIISYIPDDELRQLHDYDYKKVNLSEGRGDRVKVLFVNNEFYIRKDDLNEVNQFLLERLNEAWKKY